MRLDLGLLKRDRLITDRPIESLCGHHGRFTALPTPDSAECKPFPIHGDASFALTMKRPLPARSISTVRNCLVHGHSAALFTKEGFRQAVHWSALPELSLAGSSSNYSHLFQRNGDHWAFPSNPKLAATRRLKAGVLIGSRFSFNYFHFMCDSLVRALIAEEGGASDWPIVITKSAHQIVELLQILCPGREIVMLEPDELVHFDNLLVPISSSFSPDDPNLTPAAVVDAPYLPALQARLAEPKPRSRSSGKRIIYLRRLHYVAPDGSMARTIVNQDEVIATVEKFGAAVMSPEAMSAGEQRAAFHDADLVVSMAGSALANAVFCRPGTTVLVICQNQIVSPEYFGIVFDALGLNYVVVACPPVPGTNPHVSHRSVMVDIDVLREALDAALNLTRT